VNNWRVIFATAVIFGAGVITGGLLVNYVQHSHPLRPGGKVPARLTATNAPATNNPARPVEALRPRLPEILNKQFLQRLDEELRLKPDQHEAIQKIVNDGQNEMHKVVQDARLEIREVLTAKQHQPFDEMLKRPLRKPGGTNDASAFKARLERIIESQRANSSSEPLSPEAQVILIEAQRQPAQLEALLHQNQSNIVPLLPPTPLLPPIRRPLPTNAP